MGLSIESTLIWIGISYLQSTLLSTKIIWLFPAHVRSVFSLLLSADFSSYCQFHLWNADAIKLSFQSFVGAAVGFMPMKLWSIRIQLSTFCYSTKARQFSILSSYWIHRNYFVDSSVDTIFIGPKQYLEPNSVDGAQESMLAKSMWRRRKKWVGCVGRSRIRGLSLTI